MSRSAMSSEEFCLPSLSASSDEAAPGKYDVLRQQVDECGGRAAATKAECDRSDGSASQSQKESIKPAFLTGVTVLLALFPSLLVFRDRWLEEPVTSPSIKQWWCKIDFICRLRFPPYFLLVFACFFGVFLLVWINKLKPLGVFSNLSFASSAPATAGVSPIQFGISRIVLIASGASLAIIVVRAASQGRQPGWDLALALLAYVVGWALREIPVEEVIAAIRRNWDLIVAALLVHVALIVFLAATFSTGNPAWIPGLLLALAIFNLLRYHYRELGPVFWIISLALVLYTLNVDAWWFSIVGDEYSFYDYARHIADQQSLSTIGSRLFYGQQVYGGHPYLSSLIQAISMKLLGTNNFGWRFSSIYLSAVSIGFYFLFFKTFVSRRVALLACFFLAASQYLMDFSKIGYNNPQALFVMSLALWAAAWALRSKRPLAFVVLGLASGSCFYVYPAALWAVPLPFLLLLLYDPPRSKPAIRRWAFLIVSMLLLIFPLLLQPGYWESKEAGTLFVNPGITRSVTSIVEHVSTNWIYALMSFLYVIDESHFVAVSYIDPLSGALLVVGMAYLVKEIRKTRFAPFLVLGFFLLLLGLGASHDGSWPPTTRMFLLLPFFVLFAALGLTWVEQQLRRVCGNRICAVGFVPLVLITVLGYNLCQAYPLSRHRMERYQNLETLFLRVAMRAQELEGEWAKTFVFITDPAWSIDGIRHNQQRVYSVPSSPAQLVQVTVTDTNLPESAHAIIADPNSVVIIKPWLDAEWKRALAVSLQELGKVPCDVKTLRGTVRFQLWHSGGLETLCE